MLPDGGGFRLKIPLARPFDNPTSRRSLARNEATDATPPGDDGTKTTRSVEDGIPTEDRGNE
jgi:hypothetical protein